MKVDLTVEFKITGDEIELVLPTQVLGKRVTGWWIGSQWYPVGVFSERTKATKPDPPIKKKARK